MSDPAALQPLHHPQTFQAKYLFPFGSIVLWWAGVFWLIGDSGDFSRASFFARYILPATGFLWTVFMLYTFKTLKFVSLQRDQLLIQHFGRSQKIPLDGVESIGPGVFRIQGQPVLVIRLREPSVFGKEIAFWPRTADIATLIRASH